MHTNNNVLRGQRGRPLLVFLAGWPLLLMPIPAVLFFSLMIFEALSDPQGGGSGVLGVDDLTSFQFLAIAPVVALLVVSPMVLGYGLLRGRPWSRPLGTYLWFGIGMVTAGAQIFAGLGARAIWPVLWGLLCSAAAFWYFYRRKNVRVYYEGGGWQPRRQSAGTHR